MSSTYLYPVVAPIWNQRWYCWWKKSQTTTRTWDVYNPVNNGINYQSQVVSRISSINSMGFHILPVWKVHLECEGAADPSKWRVKFAEAEDEAEDAGVLWTKMLWGWTACALMCFVKTCENKELIEFVHECMQHPHSPSVKTWRVHSVAWQISACESSKTGYVPWCFMFEEGWADPLLEILFLVFCGWNLVVSFVSAWSCQVVSIIMVPVFQKTVPICGLFAHNIVFT